MFTQLVIATSIVSILITVNKVLEKRKFSSNSSNLSLPLGFLFVALALFCYGIRDVLIQFDFSRLEFIFYKVGGFLQLVGFFLVGIFVSKFLPGKILNSLVLAVWFLYSVFMTIAIFFFPVRTVVQQAVFEPIPYKVISHPWESALANSVYVFGGVILTLLVLFVFSYNSTTLNDKNSKIKTLLYGVGIFSLFIPTLLCLFLSPVFGRIGYIIGAIFIFIAMKIKTP